LRATEDEPSVGDDLPYRLRDDFLSPAELLFYRALTAAVGAQTVVCPKVNLGDIMFVARPNENKGARGRISQKHVDFLLCNPATMRPLVGVELDDSSHQRQDRQARDEFVDSVFAAASLPLVHVPARASYAPNEIASLLGPHVVPGSAAPSPPLATASAPVIQKESAVPDCPKCGIPMVLRTAGRGDRQREQFYGCANYPKCRETIKS
jgi:hypothetical protein